MGQIIIDILFALVTLAVVFGAIAGLIGGVLLLIFIASVLGAFGRR